MPERLRAHRQGIDRLLEHLLAGVVGDKTSINLDNGDLRTLLDALPVAILVSTDRACSRIWGNAAACQLYQLPDGQNFSRTAAPGELPPFEIYTHGKPADPDDLPLQRAARTGLPVAQSECEIRFAGGRRIFIAGHSIPIRNDYGEVCGSVGAFLDLTPQRRELELLQAVSREMSHRLKNTLAIVQAIARKTLRPLLEADVFAAFEDRLISLAKYQDLLHGQDWTGATLAQVVNLALGVVPSGASERVAAAGPEITIPPNSALMLSMILHELATNALKHGALCGPCGKIAVRWETRRRRGAQHVCLSWNELGGPQPSAEGGEGFGTSMMSSVARGLPDGRLELQFSPAGLSATLSFLIEDPDSGSRA